MEQQTLSSVTIRPITAADDPFIAKIIRTNFEQYHLTIPGTAYFDPELDHLSAFYSAKPGRGYFVAVGENGTVLGGCGFFPTQGLPEDMAEVVKLYFSPKLRGHGMGYKMLRHIEQRARQTGYRRLYIESFPEFSKAVSLYEKFGFQHISHALGNSGHSAVTIWMTKNILQTSYTQLQTT